MVRENILKVRERIASVCAKVNREPAEINIVAVSKGRAIEQIKEAIGAGITEIGENKVQEASIKYENLQLTTYNLRLKWHMVGHLQTNKVKEAVRIFGLIHSVDTLHLAEEINRQAEKINKIQDILIEVKTSPEATKSGFSPEEAIEALKEIAGLRNINIKGLMTIAPIVENPEHARQYFRLLRELLDKINNLRLTAYDLRLLSMGMTDDFEAAIEEGSNMVRLGRAVFEG